MDSASSIFLYSHVEEIKTKNIYNQPFIVRILDVVIHLLKIVKVIIDLNKKKFHGEEKEHQKF